MAETDLIKPNPYPQYQTFPSDEELEKEVYGVRQVQKNARKVTPQVLYQINQDQQSTFDEENDDIQLKKQQKLQKAPISTSIPRLASLDKVFPITEVAPPEEEEEKVEELTDSQLDRAIHQEFNELRNTHNASANIHMKEIMRRQELIHDLHAEKEKLLDQLAERMKKSKNLTWILALLTVGAAGLSLFGIPILGSVVNLIKGIVDAKTQILGIKSQKEQGDFEVLRQKHELENQKIEEGSHDRQMILNLVHKIVELELQIAKNRNQTRMN